MYNRILELPLKKGAKRPFLFCGKQRPILYSTVVRILLIRCALAWATLGVNTTSAQDCLKAQQVFDQLNRVHVNPLVLDDAFSQRLFNQAMVTLDPAGLYLNQSEIAQLHNFQTALDELIHTNSCRFQEVLESVLKRRMRATELAIDSILQKPLTFAVAEHRSLLPTQVTFAGNQRDQWEQLALLLKYQTLSEAYRMAQLEGSASPALPMLEKMLGKAQEKTRRLMLKKVRKDLQELDVETSFLQAVASAFDPHSAYMTPEQMEEFEEALSTQRLSFGIELEETPLGDVKVGRLQPGGPAWKSGLINEGDRVVQLAWSDEEPIDLTEFDRDEILDLMNDNGHTQGELTVVKPDGEKRPVLLVKEKVENTDNTVSGFILSGKHRIGYIQLPGFFSSEEHPLTRGCANEVSKEVIRLNRLQVEGIILDLRYNGGGSMAEAIELAGIFIDTGPLAILEEAAQPPVSLKDWNRGIAYGGPLVVMVNGMSASASELVAAGLQDHQRAYVVGEHTYGKATSQTLVPLQGAAQGNFIKATVGRLYRINRQSLQLTGVTPDVTIPDVSRTLLPGEGSLAHALLPKSIAKNVYYTPGTLPDITRARSNSEARVAHSANFQAIEKLKKILSEPFPLQKEAFLAKATELQEAVTAVSIHSPEAFEVKLSRPAEEFDDFSRTLAEKNKSQIQSSPIIQEAYFFFCDLLSKKP